MISCPKLYFQGMFTFSEFICGVLATCLTFNRCQTTNPLTKYMLRPRRQGALEQAWRSVLCLNCRLVQRGEMELASVLSPLLESPGESEKQGESGHFILGSCILDSVCLKCSEETRVRHVYSLLVEIIDFD